jgi:hypothetical protein
MDHFLELVEEADTDKNEKIDFGEWEIMGDGSYSGLAYLWLTKLIHVQLLGSSNVYQWLRII